MGEKALDRNIGVDVVLIRPIWHDSRLLSTTAIPHGLIALGSYLRSKGYSVALVDQNMHRDWKASIADILGRGTRLVGISSMTGLQIKKGLEISSYIKKRSSVPIIWGGVHPSILPEQTLEHPLVDAVAVGEGEEALITALQDLQRCGSIKKNRIYKNSSSLDLNLLPETDYSLFNVESYVYSQKYASRIFEICTSRGCVYSCKFCYVGPMYCRKWRCRPVSSIMNELKFITSKFRVNGINWRDDCFFLNKDRVKSIANCIIKERIKIHWRTQVRIKDVLSFESSFVKLLKESGLRSCTLGAESGSQRILDMLDKKIKVKEIVEAVKILKKHSIGFTAHFIMGLPSETRDDVEGTASLIAKLRKFSNCEGINGPHIFTPYPGTDIYKDLIKKGYGFPEKLQDWASHDWCNYKAPWISEQRWKFIRKINKSFSYTIDDKLAVCS